MIILRFSASAPAVTRRLGDARCCINRPSAFAPSAFVRHERLWRSYELMVSRADSSAVLTGQPWIYIDTHACAHSLPHVYISTVVRTDRNTIKSKSSHFITPIPSTPANGVRASSAGGRRSAARSASRGLQTNASHCTQCDTHLLEKTKSCTPKVKTYPAMEGSRADLPASLWQKRTRV